MKISHFLTNDDKIEKQAQEGVGFLLANQRGDYISLFNQPTSRYQGWFVCLDNKLFRIIEGINLFRMAEPSQLVNNFWQTVRKRDNFTESFFLPENHHSLVYELSQPKEIELTLDIKESYDNREFGHRYSISVEKDVVLIEYRRENEFAFYLAIKPDILSFQKINDWIARDYSLDQKRNAPPFQRYVYRPFIIKAQQLVFSLNSHKEKAIREAQFVFEEMDSLKQIKRKKTQELSSLAERIEDKEMRMAYLCAAHSLRSLTVKASPDRWGIYAGLPWFFQFWLRDEAISLKGLFLVSPKRAAKIALELLKQIREDGRIFDGISESADGTGWLFKRLDDLIKQEKLSRDEIEAVKKGLEKSINRLLENYTRDGLAFNRPGETWMDSQERNGFRIEIQALRLLLYQMAFRLTNKKKYSKLEEQLREAVYQKFWNGRVLADGENDFTLRPNIFLAAYLYPNLLSNKEWLECFKNILAGLWLDWGGLSTIDKNNPSFCQNHTGEDARSYHNGDAWFYLNNLVGLTLYQLGRERFVPLIDKILEASTQEILWKGVIGHHAELSSAKEFKSEGSWVQAWSSALYLELIDSLLKRVEKG